MSDWEVVSVNKKKPRSSEWEIADQEEVNPESKGFSGIASDAYNRGLNAITGIPEALMNLPSELYGAGKQIVTQPKRALQNVGAGFGELGHGVLSAPANIRDYLLKKDVISPESSWGKANLRLPESILPQNFNYAEALGAQGEQPGDVMLRGLPKGAALSPIGQLAPGINSLLNKGIGKVMPENAYKFIQRSHDIKEKMLSDIFTDVSKQAQEANVKVNLPKDLIQNIKKSGPKTDRFANFVDKAKAGNYDALRKLQSELYIRAKNYKKSDLASEKDFGDILFEQRAKINDSIIKSLAKSQKPELAEKLHGARIGWKELEDLYYSNPTIAKLVGSEREVPMTYKPLRKESYYINKLKEEHPEIQKKLNNMRRAKQISTLLGAGAYGIYRKAKAPFEDYND